MKKTCYYEILGVERDATNDDIRKGYRREALKWHPDKNMGKEEEAREVFLEVQAAYETLSNPHERAWYDDHRNSILRTGDSGGGGGGGPKVDVGEEAFGLDFDLWSFISGGSYRGYDGEDGFYAVYARVFRRLAEIEQQAARDQRLAVDGKLPGFGNASTPYAEVKTFYETWSNFTSRRTFAWVDEYHPGEAPSRNYRRAMGKENQKLRKAERREFVEAVRHLAIFTRKRDPRVVEGELAEKAERRVEEERKERQRAVRQQKHLEEKIKHAKLNEKIYEELEAEVQAMGIDLTEEFDRGKKKKKKKKKNAGKGQAADDADTQLIFTCPPCKKTFKSEPQLVQHMQSKKHRDVCKKMGLSPGEINDLVKKMLEKEDDDEGEEDKEEEEEDDDDDEEKDGEEDKGKERDEEAGREKDESDDGNDDDNNDGDEKDRNRNDEEKEKEKEELSELEEQERKKKEKMELQQKRQEEKAQRRKERKEKRKKKGEPAAAGDAADSWGDFEDEGEKRGDRGRRGEGAAPATVLCRKCKATFPSKTKLHEHLKATGHATIKK